MVEDIAKKIQNIAEDCEKNGVTVENLYALVEGARELSIQVGDPVTLHFDINQKLTKITSTKSEATNPQVIFSYAPVEEVK
jgi:hypothetical protein